MRNINKLFLFLIVIFSSVILYSCNGGSTGIIRVPNSSDLTYYEIKRFIYDNQVYSVQKVKDAYFLETDKDIVKSNIYYYVHEYSKPEGLEENWLINYKLDLNRTIYRYISDEALVQEFYNNIEMSIKEHEVEFNLELDYYESLKAIEKEFSVDMSKEYSSVIAVDAYLPYMILNETTGKYIYFSVPIKSFLGYKNNDNIEFVCDDKIISVDYQTFMTSSNVFK